MRKRVWRLASAGPIFLVAIFLGGGAWAQGGSIGGSIPGGDKTVSGGESKKPETHMRRRAKPHAHAARRSLSGRWVVKQKCNTGEFEIELTIKQSSPTSFTGSTIGITTGKHAKIADGRIDRNTVTFTRKLGVLSDRWTAHLKGTGRFTGTSVGVAWRCSYTAKKS